MAAAVFVAGGLRIFLPSQLRLDDARPLLVVVLAVLMGALIVGDPGRIDRKKTWLRVLTGVLIGVITVVNAGASVRLVYAIVQTEPFTNDANILLVSGGIIWLTNMIAFGLWYWDLDRGGGRPCARNRHFTGVRVPRDVEPGTCPGRLVPVVRGLPAPVLQHFDGIQPDGRLGDKAVGEAHDDGRGGDLSSRWNPRRRPGGQYPEVGPGIPGRRSPAF